MNTKKTQKEHSNAERRRTLLCSGLANEISQTVSSISLASEFLEKHTFELVPADKKQTAQLCFEALDDGVFQLSRVAENLTDLLACQTFKLEAHLQLVDLHWQFGRVLQSFLQSGKMNGANIIWNFEGLATVFVKADPAFADKVFLNLLSNALRSGADEPVVHVLFETESDCLQLTIKDNGLGIEPAVMEHLFEPFSSDHAEICGKHGCGLGLYLAHEYCGCMGWTMNLETGDEGTTVTVTIPTEKDAAGAQLNSATQDLAFCTAQDRRINMELCAL